MDVYKDFLQHLRRQSFDEVYILLSDITPKLTNYVQLLTKVKYEDGSYYTFYGEVKKIIGSFVVYFIQTVDDVVKEADTCSNEMTKDDLMILVEQTISTHHSNQVDFGNEFLPITSPSEKEIYEQIEGKYKEFLKKLYEFQEMVDKIPTQDKLEDFVKNHFEITVRRTSDILNFTYLYLGMMLADCLKQTRTSLEEILLRMSNNLRKMQDECEETLNNLLDQLYDKNKESMAVSRRDRHSSIDLAEVNHGIKLIRDKIENLESENPLSRLEEEVTYWQGRLKEFNEVATNIDKLKTEQENMAKQEMIYNSMRTTELPGSKRQCWDTMGTTFAERNAYLKQKLKEEARALVTFFACRGSDRILYMDNTGQYYIDEFNHHMYVPDHGLGYYHVNCEGEFTKVRGAEYYFDNYGRYVKPAGGNEKVYQLAPCTSQYKLNHSNLLEKLPVTSGQKDLQCIKDLMEPTNNVILPDFDPVDISGTLNTETVKYLWDTFGALLPDALHDVGIAKPKNPIQVLAHKLLFHKYKSTMKELRQKKTEAEEYRAKIFNERKEKAVAATKSWRSKQVQRRKPEASDDTQERAVYDAQAAQRAFINSLDYYNT